MCPPRRATLHDRRESPFPRPLAIGFADPSLINHRSMCGPVAPSLRRWRLGCPSSPATLKSTRSSRYSGALSWFSIFPTSPTHPQMHQQTSRYPHSRSLAWVVHHARFQADVPPMATASAARGPAGNGRQGAAPSHWHAHLRSCTKDLRSVPVLFRLSFGFGRSRDYPSVLRTAKVALRHPYFASSDGRSVDPLLGSYNPSTLLCAPPRSGRVETLMASPII